VYTHGTSSQHHACINQSINSSFLLIPHCVVGLIREVNT